LAQMGIMATEAMAILAILLIQMDQSSWDVTSCFWHTKAQSREACENNEANNIYLCNNYQCWESTAHHCTSRTSM
jgi:hypothetical protein